MGDHIQNGSLFLVETLQNVYFFSQGSPELLTVPLAVVIENVLYCRMVANACGLPHQVSKDLMQPPM